MILQSLNKLYDRLESNPIYDIAGSGYSRQRIGFRVVLNEDGSLLDNKPQSMLDKQTKRGISMIVPGGDKPPGMVTEKSVHKKVNLLRNDMPFLLGLDIDNDKVPVVAELQFEAFREYHLSIRDQINDPEFSIVCRFLETWNPEEQVERSVDWVQSVDGIGVFQICGRTHYVHEQPSVREWWNGQQQTGKGNETYRAQCLITGERLPIARLHEPKIKNVYGAQSSGAPIVSFDKASNAFSSYGGDGAQGFNAPVSELAAFRYASALNALTSGPASRKHRFTLGDATFVFWTDTPTNTEDIFAQFATGNLSESPVESQDVGVVQKAQLFFKALRKGRDAVLDLDKSADTTPFYLLGLTGQAKGRLGVRLFYTDTLSALMDNLQKHYHDLRLVRMYGDGSKSPDPVLPALYRLLDETCSRDNNNKPRREQIPPILEGPMLRSVITGAPYPYGLFSAIMRRIHADRTINYVRGCVIAGYLRRNLKQEVSVTLDTNSKDPAYRLGRLFAVLEKVQGDALGDTNANVRDRFYSAASATPGTVFPRLLRTYQHHLAKLQPGLKISRERLTQEILEPISAFPSHFGLPAQGQFALGYYHESKNLWTSKQNRERQEEEQS